MSPNELMPPGWLLKEAAELVTALRAAIESDLQDNPLAIGVERLYPNPFGADLVPIRVIGTKDGKGQWYIG